MTDQEEQSFREQLAIKDAQLADLQNRYNIETQSLLANRQRDIDDAVAVITAQHEEKLQRFRDSFALLISQL